MGSLKPGATYIYEKSNGITYAREFGSIERKAIGWDSSALIQEGAQQWYDILVEAETNPSLQKAIDRVIMIYKLSKDKV
jgi:hypothetical protein